MTQNAKSKKMNGNKKVYLSVGSNLSYREIEPPKMVHAACNALFARGMRNISNSSLFHSKAWPPGTDAPDYVNIAVAINDFEGSPFELLGIINEIETSYGRARDAKNQWAPRSLDIDIIDFKGIILDEIQNHKHLILPHPRAHLRDFVLLPLKEVAPNWVHPATKQTIEELITQLPQNNEASA